MTEVPGRGGGTDQLDERLRALHVDTDAVLLAESSVVRRQGDRRRRVTRAGALLGVAVLTVGIVGIASILADRQTAAPPATPTPTASEQRLSVAGSPFLQSGDISPIGAYTSFTEGPSRFGWDIGGDCFTNPYRWGAIGAQSRNFISDLDASFVETVLVFVNDESAKLGAEHPVDDFVNFPRVGTCAASETGTPRDRSPEELRAGDQAYRLSRLLTPTADGGLEYHEIAVGRVGRIVVVLDWGSLGPPASADGWAWTAPLVATALERAVAP